MSEVRSILLGQIRPQIRSLETRLQQARTDRLQAALRLFIFDGITSLGYAIGFAAIGRSGDDMPSLLQICLWMPEELQERLALSRKANRDRGPISEQWITTLSDAPDADPSEEAPQANAASGSPQDPPVPPAAS